MGRDSDDPDERGRGRQVRRRRRHAGRHGGPVRRHRPRRGHHVDDDQLAGRRDPRHVHRDRREERRRARPAGRHAAERHPEGVPSAEGVRVPTAPVDAAGARHRGVLHGRDAPLASDLDLRLPHPRGRLDRRAGARLHVGQRLRLRRVGAGGRARGRCVRARLSFFFNAHIDFFEEIAKYRAARRIWATWMRDRYGAVDTAIDDPCGSTRRRQACR